VIFRDQVTNNQAGNPDSYQERPCSKLLVLIETVMGKLNQPTRLQMAEAFMILIDK
jgi:hypothetical protein